MSTRGVGRSVTASVVASFLACLVAVGALIVWVTNATFDRERDRAEDELTEVAASQAAELGSLFDSAVPLIRDLASNPALRPLDPRACRQAFAPLVSVRAQARLVVVAGDGRTVCALS
ncbi:hypothetical protein, partial [Nocardioides pelophilus]|uniref:hypothetical protein n=1 Tax=Nocardioides pelophilus TaxID=2172019 RepID=UPI0016043FAA